jgi:hypothetical protein
MGGSGSNGKSISWHPRTSGGRCPSSSTSTMFKPARCAKCCTTSLGLLYTWDTCAARGVRAAPHSAADYNRLLSRVSCASAGSDGPPGKHAVKSTGNQRSSYTHSEGPCLTFHSLPSIHHCHNWVIHYLGVRPSAGPSGCWEGQAAILRQPTTPTQQHL